MTEMVVEFNEKFTRRKKIIIYEMLYEKIYCAF